MQTESLPFQDVSVLSVSALNRQARLALEGRLGEVWVRGEISNYRRPGSGHWYFTLKDDSAQVRCAMFVNRNRFSKLQPADGAEVILRGKVSLYEGRGDYQIIVEHMEPAGEGALRAAFEALKERLAAEGLFSTERKQALPRFPAHLAVLSSRSGAALRDVLSIVARRFPCLKVTLIPVAVQGPDAERQLLGALQRIPALQPDIVLLTRGGGSLEDLFVFNSEPLARAIAACPVPTVAAIGHETDFTIAELVADLRGPTPSAAADLPPPDGQALAQQFAGLEARLGRASTTRIDLARSGLDALRAKLIDPRHKVRQLMQRADDLDERLLRAAAGRLERIRTRVDALGRSVRLLSPAARIANHRQTLERLTATARNAVTGQVRNGQRSLAALARTLGAVSPLDTLSRGFVIVTDPDGRAITESAGLAVGEEFLANFHDGAVRADVRNKQPLPARLQPLGPTDDTESAT
ncbi:MAG: exodeoxyribonuclease VII large subunit [Gammaproteobacteria bacterium]|nr:exodeoxyribonuclease VII large subunit [Gammaproteobacteria bacterium]